MSERRKARASRTVGGVLSPFNRTPDAWRAMGAPRWTWDDGAAVRTARRVLRPGLRMDGPEWAGSRSQADRTVARRLRTAAAAAVLAARGQLTERERELVARFPGQWRTEGPHMSLVDGVTLDSLAAGDE